MIRQEPSYPSALPLHPLRQLAVHAQQPSVTISLSAWGPAHACEEPLRFFDLRNFGPRVEADEGGNEQFAGDLIPTGRLIELCK